MNSHKEWLEDWYLRAKKAFGSEKKLEINWTSAYAGNFDPPITPELLAKRNLQKSLIDEFKKNKLETDSDKGIIHKNPWFVLTEQQKKEIREEQLKIRKAEGWWSPYQKYPPLQHRLQIKPKRKKQNKKNSPLKNLHKKLGLKNE